jgi:6-phosphogluconolactonase
MKKQIIITPDRESLIDRALHLILDRVKTAIADRDACTIVLSGGSTPAPLYTALAEQDLPWEKIHIFWGDERYVPPTHPDSNYGMTAKVWLDRISIPPDNIHSMPTNFPEPATAANTYAAEIQSYFGVEDDEFPTFDIILLGMGDDGHTASLFPHTAALSVLDRLVTVGDKDGQPRLTFTAPLINQSRCIIFLVSGANKQAALAEVFAPTGDASTYPSRLIQPADELFWLLDAAAGEKLGSIVDI